MRIISGLYKGRVLKTTSGPGLRPAMGVVRKALFSMLEAQGIDWPTTRVLDLFAGTGSLGFEALSRGASYTCFIESAPYAVKVLQSNANLINVPESNLSIINNDVHKVLNKRPNQPYDLVFIDPPYALTTIEHVIFKLRKNMWLSERAFINAEVESTAKISTKKIDNDLELLVDREYGQTRVLIWTLKNL